MSWMRPLGSTGITVSALGLGAVKLGRNQGLKYPQGFTVPDDRSAASLLAQARELGINLLDTAPAYGNSEERLGKLLRTQRQHWLICSKVGEEFEGGVSRFDFSAAATRLSVHRSLRRLHTDVIDIVLVHSDGQDRHIIEDLETVQALQQLKQEGLIRAFGVSTKTVAGGLAAAACCDVVMLTYNSQHQNEAQVLEACALAGKGALVKKALASGHFGESVAESVQESLRLVLGHPGTGAAVVGTISPTHLEQNVLIAKGFLD
jgi:aryl-alcohol dehydrogenase-like predicted oxidoreductase